MVWRAPKGSPAEFPEKGSKVDTWLGVMQPTLGNSDSSSSKNKIISLIHALSPLAKANQHLIPSQNPNYYYPKQQEHPKAKLTTLGQNPRNDSLRIF